MEGEKDRERQSHRWREREAETKRDGKRERDRWSERDRDREKEAERDRDKERNRQIYREMERDRETERERERHTERDREKRSSGMCRQQGLLAGSRRVPGGSTNGPGWAGGRREVLPGAQAVCRVAARVTSLTSRRRGSGRGGAGQAPSHLGAELLASSPPPAAAVNTGALHADRDRHSGGRGRVGWKGLRQRGLLGEPLRHLYLTGSPEGSRVEGSS